MTEVDENRRQSDPTERAPEDGITHVVHEPEPGGKSSARPRALHHFTPAERAARGKAARAELPRSMHGTWEPAPNRDPPP